MIPAIGDLMVALVMIGMAASFFGADPRSPTSRALSLAFAFGGATQLLNVFQASGYLEGDVRFWSRAFGLGEACSLLAGLEWLVRVWRTEGATDRGREQTGVRLLRIGQTLLVFYAIFSVVLPETRLFDFHGVDPSNLDRHRRGWEKLALPGYWLFAICWDGTLLLALVSIVRLLRSRLDPAERVRLIAICVATPFLFSGMFVASKWRPVTTLIGELVFLAAAIRYHVLQGQRGQFLARFLSPQVRRLVREEGLASISRKSRVELSVVACDLRGFTAFSESAAPEEVMRLLEDYYDAVGNAVSEHGGSIKDFSGDGVLSLVGAPVAYQDHARRAVVIALEIRARMTDLLARWRALGHELGLGVGIASGFATVGTIGSGHLEYAAVGPVVNLASRLCSLAEPGQILADQRIVGLGAESDFYRFEQLETVALKGFSRPIKVFHVVAGAGAMIDATSNPTGTDLRS